MAIRSHHDSVSSHGDFGVASIVGVKPGVFARTNNGLESMPV